MSDSDDVRPDAGPIGTAAAQGRRGYVAALSFLAVGAAVLFLALGRVWVSVTVSDAGLPSLHVDLTGRDLQPEGAAVALVALAGIAGLVATRRAGRLISGVVLVVVGVGAAVRAVMFGLTHGSRPGYGDTIASLVSERTGVDLPQITANATQWWVGAVLGGLVVAAGGALALLRGRTWPVMGGRYERRDPGVPGSQEAASAAARRHDSAWEQLDRGVDPTLHGAGGTGPAATPETAPDPTLGGSPLA